MLHHIRPDPESPQPFGTHPAPDPSTEADPGLPATSFFLNHPWLLPGGNPPCKECNALVSQLEQRIVTLESELAIKDAQITKKNMALAGMGAIAVIVAILAAGTIFWYFR